MKILYFDCFAGISGDMTLGALLDLGVPLKHLTRELGCLKVSGYGLRSGAVQRSARVWAGVAPPRRAATMAASLVPGGGLS